jgi:hypothetical protein
MRIVAAIHAPDAITKILDSLGLPASSPRLWQKPPLIFLTIASVCGLTDDLDIIEFAENRSEKGASRTFIIGNDDAQLFDRPRHEDFADVAYAAESLR